MTLTFLTSKELLLSHYPINPDPKADPAHRTIHVEVLTRGRQPRLTLFQRLKLWLLFLGVLFVVAAFVGIGLSIGLLLLAILGVFLLLARILFLFRKKRPPR